MVVILIGATWFIEPLEHEPEPPPEIMPLALITILLVAVWIGVVWLTKRPGDRERSTAPTKGPDPRSESWWGG